MDDGKTIAGSRPFWRNPWAIAFVVGIGFVTFMTPRMRYIPEPPRAIGTLPATGWVSATGEGGVPWGARATVIGFVSEGGPECPNAGAMLRKLAIAFAQAEVPVEVATVAIGWAEASEAKRVASATHRQGGARSGLSSWSTRTPESLAEVLMGRSAAGACDAFGLSGVVTIVDASGGARGIYRVGGGDALSEVYHRSQHVAFMR